MTLTRAEVEAIVDYIYTHVRANPTGRRSIHALMRAVHGIEIREI